MHFIHRFVYTAVNEFTRAIPDPRCNVSTTLPPLSWQCTRDNARDILLEKQEERRKRRKKIWRGRRRRRRRKEKKGLLSPLPMSSPEDATYHALLALDYRLVFYPRRNHHAFYRARNEASRVGGKSGGGKTTVDPSESPLVRGWKEEPGEGEGEGYRSDGRNVVPNRGEKYRLFTTRREEEPEES